jgi:hypothetical protein
MLCRILRAEPCCSVMEGKEGGGTFRFFTPVQSSLTKTRARAWVKNKSWHSMQSTHMLLPSVPQ